MVDITVTAANVIPQAGLRKQTGVAGAALTIGLAVYRKTSDKRWYSSDKDVAEDAEEYGITLSQAAAAGQPVVVGGRKGKLAFGAILTVGESYYVGEAAGGICPSADVGAAEYRRFLGYATTTSILAMDVNWQTEAHG